MSDSNSAAFSLGSNSLTAAGTLTLGGTCVSAVMVTTMILPAQTLGLAAIGGGLLYAGSRKAAGKSIVPSFANDSAPTVDPTPVTQETDTAAAAA